MVKLSFNDQSMSIGCVGKLGHLSGFLWHYLLNTQYAPRTTRNVCYPSKEAARKYYWKVQLVSMKKILAYGNSCPKWTLHKLWDLRNTELSVALWSFYLSWYVPNGCEIKSHNQFQKHGRAIHSFIKSHNQFQKHGRAIHCLLLQPFQENKLLNRSARTV